MAKQWRSVCIDGGIQVSSARYERLKVAVRDCEAKFASRPQVAIHLKESRHSNPLPQVPSSLASCSTQVSANALPQNKILRDGAPAGHLAGVWAQAKVERCTALGVACSPQPTAMCPDKRTGYRQPQAQTVVLGREKRLEYLLKLTLSNADATIGY